MASPREETIDAIANQLLALSMRNGPLDKILSGGGFSTLVEHLQGESDSLAMGALAARLRVSVQKSLSNENAWKQATLEYLMLSTAPIDDRIDRHEAAFQILHEEFPRLSKPSIRKNQKGGSKFFRKLRLVAAYVISRDGSYPEYVERPDTGVCDRSTWEAITRYMLACDNVAIVGVAPIPLARLIQEEAFRKELGTPDRLRSVNYLTPSSSTILSLDAASDGPEIYTRWAEGLLSFVNAANETSSEEPDFGSDEPILRSFPKQDPSWLQLAVFDRRLMSCMIFYFGHSGELAGVSVLVHTPHGDILGMDADGFVHAWAENADEAMSELLGKIEESTKYFDLRYVTVDKPTPSRKRGVAKGHSLAVAGFETDERLSSDNCVPVASVLATIEGADGPALIVHKRSPYAHNRDVGTWAVPSSRIQELDYVAFTEDPFRDSAIREGDGAKASRLIRAHYWKAQDENGKMTLHNEAVRNAAKRALMRRCGVNIDSSSIDAELSFRGTYILERGDVYDLAFMIYGVRLPSDIAESILAHSEESLEFVTFEKLKEELEELDGSRWKDNPLFAEGGDWIYSRMLRD